jgi:hypothetical protein
VSSDRQQIAARRERLRARSERLRSELAGDAAALGRRFALADRIVAVARSGAVRPLLVGAATLLLFNRPRRLLRLAVKALALWPAIAPLVPHVKRLLAARDDSRPSAE